MVKNTLKVLYKVIIVAMAYILQIYVINNNELFGVNGDLCLMAVAVITLLENNCVAYAVAGVCGIVSDILFSSIICKYVIIYLIVVSVLIGFKKMYKQDSKVSVIIFSAISVLVSEILNVIFNIIFNGNMVNIFAFVFMVIKECIINICLAFVVYLLYTIYKKEE